ncbi:MAG: TaqI-like C-terminal specificity domain-containing protein, partial [Patescibacteria group bacterium]
VLKKPYSHNSKINESCRKLLEGKNIEKYKTNFNGNWLEYGEWIAAPRKKEMFEGERIVLRRIVGKEGLISQYLKDDYVNNSLLHVVKLCSQLFDTKFVLSILNSKLIGFYFISKYARKEKTFPEIRIHELENLPIRITEKLKQTSFIHFVDFLLFLNNKENPAILSHTENTRIASHLEDMLNMMVYE